MFQKYICTDLQPLFTICYYYNNNYFALQNKF